MTQEINNMRVRIEGHENMIKAWTPENNSVHVAFWKMGGERDRETGEWTFPRTILRDVRRLCAETFADDGIASDRVDVRIHAPKEIEKMGENFSFAGRYVGNTGHEDRREMQAFLVAGAFMPSGGGKTRKISVRAGTELILADIPRAAAVSDDTFEVIEIYERVPAPEELRAERAYCAQRIEEIDAMLTETAQADVA